MQPRTPKPFSLGIFWLGIQMVWGALLGISLQARATELAGARAVAAYGTLAIVGAAVAAVTQIAVGILSDRRRLHGSRRIEFYAFGSLASAGALVWFYAAPSFALLVAALVVLQISMNVAIGPYQAVIPDFVGEEDLGAASSWLAALQSAGNAAGALLAGLVSNTRIVAAGIAAVLLASCALTSAHVRALPLRAVDSQPLRFTKSFVDLFVSRALMYVGFYTLLGYLFFYVQRNLGGDVKTTTAIVLLVFTLAGAGGALAASRPARVLDRRALASAGGAGFVAALFAFLFSHSIVAIVASACIAGAAWGVFLTADWALGCQFLPRFALATAMGVWNLALLIPQILAPLIATGVLTGLHALQNANAASIAFVLAAIEVVFGIAWIWRLPAYARSFG